MYPDEITLSSLMLEVKNSNYNDAVIASMITEAYRQGYHDCKQDEARHAELVNRATA